MAAGGASTAFPKSVGTSGKSAAKANFIAYSHLLSYGRKPYSDQ
jgi:hypothetical protein